MTEIVPAQNQRHHEGIRMQSWRFCPLCGMEFKRTFSSFRNMRIVLSFRDQWRKHFIADHKRDDYEARQLLDDCYPLGKGEWDAS